MNQSNQQPLSKSLRELPDKLSNDKLSIDDLLSHFGSRSYGAIITLFTIPNLLPGISSFSGIALILFSIQMIAGIKTPWLPAVIKNHHFHKQSVIRGVDFLVPHIQKVEAYLRPRMLLLTSGLALRLLGFIAALLSFLVIIPIPLGNFIPAIILLVVGLALAQKDGLMAIISSFIGVGFAFYYLGFVWHLLVKLWQM